MSTEAPVPATQRLPTGTVTFLFTDIEGSTKLVQRLGRDFRGVLEEHNRILRDAIRGNGGFDRGTEGDAFFAVFPTADAAVSAAVAAQRGLAGHAWPGDVEVRVRMGLHTGEGVLGGDDYVGLDVHRAARIAAAGHGGQILVSRTTAALCEGSLGEGLSLRDLGPHRLKDLPDPEHILQLVVADLDREFPPLRTLEVATNLPAFPTSFIGRQADVAAVRGRLGEARLVTITGPGGTGKTRLSVEAARQERGRFRDGVTFVDLSATTEPHLVCHDIAAALGMRPSGTDPVWDAIAERLRDQTALMVLDNFEQVLGAAPDVGRLLSEAPALSVLATSREALGIRGEHLYPLAPLELGGENGEGTSEAVALFLDRAREVDPAFDPERETLEAIAQICARLDGMPLAIELAASRLSAISTRELLDRLDRRLPLLTTGPRDAPARQRTLRGAIEWSHDLLDEPERVLFRRCGVFAGGWILWVLEPIVDPERELGDLLDLSASLVQKNLVRRDPGSDRYSMYETIREFALEKLEEAGELADVRERMAWQAALLADHAEPHLIGMKRTEWLERLAENHENLRAGLEWSIETDTAEVGLRIVAGVWRFWQFRGFLAEGRHWGEQVLALPSAQARTSHRGRARLAVAGLAYWQGDYDEMERSCVEALEVFREAGDEAGEAEALYNLSFVEHMRRAFEAALRNLDESRAIHERLGSREGVGRADMAHAFMASAQGHFEEARTLVERALEGLRGGSDLYAYENAAGSLAQIMLEQGDVEGARPYVQETFEMSLASMNLPQVMVGLHVWAMLASRSGHHERAMRLVGAAEGLGERVQAVRPAAFLRTFTVEPPPEMSEETAEALKAEGRAMRLEDAVAYARSED